MMINLEFLNKLKGSNPLVGFTSFIFCILFFSACFLCLDYRGIRILLRSGIRTSNRRPGFLQEGAGRCDLFDGSWVWDERYPLYESRNCRFLDDGFRCSENGRPDRFYAKWRWQPRDCNLPRFDAMKMLENLRNRRLVFVGDSIGRNQWESLLCMLSSSIPGHEDSVYEVNGNPITKHSGFLAFMFKDFNCTVEYYRAPFLVLQSRKPNGAPERVKSTLKLDVMDWSSSRWKDADVIVFNTGHWWNKEKTIRGGCYFQEDKVVKMEMSVESAYRKSIETVFDWIRDKLNTNKTQVFFRTYAPIHFSGDRKLGGSCHKETLPDFSHKHENLDDYKVFSHEIWKHTSKSQVELLNVTFMSAQRRDAHPSLYYLGPPDGPAPFGRQDCSHWCLPGVPDTWNDLLYALFLKRQS